MPNNNKIHKEMAKSIFYHAGCPVCVSAEHDIVNLIGARCKICSSFANSKWQCITHQFWCVYG